MGPEDSDATRDAPFHVMAMPTGPACNLGCEYCYYLNKAELYPDGEDFRMSTETLETFVKQYVEAQPGPEVTFAWQGGEPTLRGLDFYREAVRLQREHAPPGKRVVNALQTNGTRLDDEWGRFLAENDFLVGLSVDGPPDLHDEFRRTRAGEPTFEAVAEGLAVLRRHGVRFNVLCVVNAVNARYPLRVYDFFKRLGARWLQFVPLVELREATDGASGRGTAHATGTGTDRDEAPRGEGGGEEPADEFGVPTGRPTREWVRDRGGDVEASDGDYRAVVEAARDAPTTDRSVDPVAYGEFVCAIFDEWVREDVGSVSVRLFDQWLQTGLEGRASHCVFDETCGDQVAMEHDGDVYACDHFVEPGFRLGNVHETHLRDLLDDEGQRAFGAYKREGLPARCRECDVRRFCHGGCPKNRHLATPDGELGLNYLCAGYRRFFTHARPYLECFEAAVEDRRPLSSVTDAVAARDARAGNT
ncbi:MAG: anaerobic sulfatase maturase [Halosimplex sp.]